MKKERKLIDIGSLFIGLIMGTFIFAIISGLIPEEPTIIEIEKNITTTECEPWVYDIKEKLEEANKICPQEITINITNIIQTTENLETKTAYTTHGGWKTNDTWWNNYTIN